MGDRVKIVAKDNHDRETVSDWLIADNVVRSYAEDIVAQLNSCVGEDSLWYYFVMPMDYELYDAYKNLY